MKKLIIHAGLAKTGTTTLQTFSYVNRDMLVNEGIYYSDVFLHDATAHHKLSILVASGKLEDVKSGLTNLYKSSGSAEYVIVSSEEISTLNSSCVSKLLEIATSVFDSVEVVFSIRPHYSLFIGSYKQQLREGFIKSGISEFWLLARKHARFLHLEKFCKMWFQEIKKYNASISYICTESGISGYSGDVLSNFYKYICADIEIESFSIKKNKNRSLSSGQIVFLQDIYEKADFLWDEKVSWDQRRFTLYCYQMISNKFKRIGVIEDNNFIASEILILESCKSLFKKDWLSLCGLPGGQFLPDVRSIDEWYDRKSSIHHKKLESNKSEKNRFFYNKNDRGLLENIFKFYDSNKNLSEFGPSDQVSYYLKNS